MSDTIAATLLLLLLQEVKRKVASFRFREDHYRKLAALETTPPKTREEFEMRAFNFDEICTELETILPPDTKQNDDSNSIPVTVPIGAAAEVSGGACCDAMCGSEYCPRCS